MVHFHPRSFPAESQKPKSLGWPNDRVLFLYPKIRENLVSNKEIGVAEVFLPDYRGSAGAASPDISHYLPSKRFPAFRRVRNGANSTIAPVLGQLKRLLQTMAAESFANNQSKSKSTPLGRMSLTLPSSVKRKCPLYRPTRNIGTNPHSPAAHLLTYSWGRGYPLRRVGLAEGCW